MQPQLITSYKDVREQKEIEALGPDSLKRRDMKHEINFFITGSFLNLRSVYGGKIK